MEQDGFEFAGFYRITAPQLIMIGLHENIIKGLISMANNDNDKKRIQWFLTELKIMKGFLDSISMDSKLKDLETLERIQDGDLNWSNEDIIQLQTSVDKTVEDLVLCSLYNPESTRPPRQRPIDLSRPNDSVTYKEQTLVMIDGLLRKFNRAYKATDNFLHKVKSGEAVIDTAKAQEVQHMLDLMSSINDKTVPVVPSVINIRLGESETKTVTLTYEQRKVIEYFKAKSQMSRLNKAIELFSNITFDNRKIFGRNLSAFAVEDVSNFYRFFKGNVGRTFRLNPTMDTVINMKRDLRNLEDLIGEDKSAVGDLLVFNNKSVTGEPYIISRNDSMLEDKLRSVSNDFTTYFKNIGKEGFSSLTKQNALDLAQTFSSLQQLTYGYYRNKFKLDNISNEKLEACFNDLDDLGFVGLNTIATRLFEDILLNLTLVTQDSVVFKETDELNEVVSNIRRYLNSQFLQEESVVNFSRRINEEDRMLEEELKTSKK